MVGATSSEGFLIAVVVALTSGHMDFVIVTKRVVHRDCS